MTKPRVLIVDDSPISAEVLVAYLHDLAECTTITHGFEGLTNPNAAIYKRTDILVCDLILPEISGLHIMNMVADHHSHIKIICVSGAEGALFDEAKIISDAVFSKTTDPMFIVEAILA